jgi:hypothetical protein
LAEGEHGVSHTFVAGAERASCFYAFNGFADSGAALLGEKFGDLSCQAHTAIAFACGTGDEHCSNQSPASAFHIAHSGTETGRNLGESFAVEVGKIGQSRCYSLTAVVSIVLVFKSLVGKFFFVHKSFFCFAKLRFFSQTDKYYCILMKKTT